MKFYFNKLKFKLFIKYVEKFNDPELIIDYANNNKLSSEQIYVLAVLLCKADDPTVILEFVLKQHVSDKNCLNMLGSSIYKSDNLYCMHTFASSFPGIPVNDDIIKRMCELGDTSHILPYLKSEFVAFSTKRAIVSTIIKEGTNEQLDNLVSEYYDFLMDQEKDAIKEKVCESLKGKLICNVAAGFKDEDKKDFVDAICLVEHTKFKYSFLEQNRDLTETQNLQIVLEICKSDEIEYIYKTLLLFKDGPNNIKRLLLNRVREINDPKYLMLTAIYLDEEYLIKNFDKLDRLYAASVLSDDINEVFTNDELVDMYKHMQKVKNLRLEHEKNN